MSLLDAILSEPHRDPREVWISVRNDGQKGVGTIDNPADGGTRLGPALLAGLTCNRREFVVGTRSPHGLLETDVDAGDIITIKNVRGPGMAWFNKTLKLKAILSPLHLVLEFAETPSGVPPAPPATEASGYEYITVEYPNHAGGSSPLSSLAAVYWPVAKVTTGIPHGLPPFGAVRLTGFGAPFDGDQFALGSDVLGTPSRAFYFQFPAPLPSADVTSSISGTAAAMFHRFDDVMRTIPEYSVVHLGPGTYETRGAASIYAAAGNQVYVGCLVQRGQKLRGAGIGATTLKLVLPLDGLNMTAVLTRFTSFPVPLVDGFEAEALTIDCNAPGHVAPYGGFPARVTCGAVALYGSFRNPSRLFQRFVWRP